MKHCKFTLVELMVVIAIIGILASILIPSLARSRQLAYTATCSSQLSQYTKAILLFAGDNDGKTPPGGRIQVANGGISASEAQNSIQVSGNAVGYVENSAPYLGVDLDYSSINALEASATDEEKMRPFICPADANPLEINATQWDNYHQFISKTSFGCNAAMFASSDNQARHVNNKLVRVSKAEKTALLFDSQPAMFSTNITHLYSGVNKPTMYEFAILTGTWGQIPKPIRHGEQMNISFVDGHIRVINPNKLGALREVYLNKGL